MKQILQNLSTGRIEVLEIPRPLLKSNHILINSCASLISSGTERMLLEFGRANLLEKAMQQPDKVHQVVNKIKTDGLFPTASSVLAKLDQPLGLGYCNAGVIEEIDSTSQASNLRKGDRVVSNGPHAEIICVPKNLCVKIPDNVSNEEATFTIPGSIGLQGIRLAQPTLGERFIVYGLGLIGLMTVQILKANGCKVIGVDLDPIKCELASKFGVEIIDLSKGEDPISSGLVLSQGYGVDGVLITASTKSNDLIRQAAQICRKRGRIILIGVAGLKLNRADFYEKELSFQVSCSYGPGRYDPAYEDKGHDYPIGFVRWTEQRNFEAVLDLISSKKLKVKPLISHRFHIDNAEKAYNLVAEKKEAYLGIILNYNNRSTKKKYQQDQTIYLKDISKIHRSQKALATVNVGLIGAGNFTRQVLLPCLKKSKAQLRIIASSGGINSTHFGKKFGFEQSTTDIEKVFSDQEINTIFIITRHDTHANLTLKALENGKHVFVEKPLCLTLEEIKKIVNFYNRLSNNNFHPLLMVGFNRRFAPHIIKIRELLHSIKTPKSFIMTVNAGYIPENHWTQDRTIGGGRIIGEACHFIDLLRFLAGCEIQSSNIIRIKNNTIDTASISLCFTDNSIATIHFFANGNKSFPKERLEIFCEGKILQLDNFKVLKGYGWKNFKTMKLWSQDKGHVLEVAAFIEAVKNGGESPIPINEIIEVARKSIELELDTS